MSLTTTNVKNEYEVVSSTSSFSFTFKWFELDNVKVYQEGTLLVEDTDYTVSGTTSEQVGGQIDLTTAMTSGTLLIIRETPVLQEAEYGVTTAFPSASVQGVDDRTVAMIQEASDKTESVPYFPSPEADQVIGWNADASALENKSLPDIEEYEQLSDDVEAASALATSAKSTADTALSTAETAETVAGVAQTTANTANSKADANTSDLANTEAKASAALSLATNNEADIAAIDTEDFVKKTDYEPRISAIETQQDLNTPAIADNEADILALESDVQDLHDELDQFTGRVEQYVGNGVATPTIVNTMVFNQAAAPYAEVTIHFWRKTDEFYTTGMMRLLCFWDNATSLWDVHRLITNETNLDGITFSMNTDGTVGTLQYITNTIAGTGYDGHMYVRADKILA